MLNLRHVASSEQEKEFVADLMDGCPGYAIHNLSKLPNCSSSILYSCLGADFPVVYYPRFSKRRYNGPV